MAFLSAVLSYAQTEIRVQTHNVVATDEQFNITFIIEGESKSSDFSWSPGEDFQLLWGPQSGRSTSVQIVNGKTTKTVQNTYSYVLRPIKAGTFTVAQASAKVNGKTIYSKPVSIEVVESASSSGTSQSQRGQSDQGQRQAAQNGAVKDSDIFLTMSLSRRNVVVGEPITATVKLYQRVNVAGFESVEFPSFNGFWSQELEAPSNIEFTRESYNGQIYNSALLRKWILIPQQQGKVTIDPAELVCLVNVRMSSGGNSVFDGFFDDYATVRKKASSGTVTVNVEPLPAGAPASFSGGVGEFTISAQLSRDSLATHEAASLLVTVSGKGNVSLLEAPKVKFPPDMEVYDTKVSEKIDKGGISGSKFYEFPFIPRSHGDFIIEPIKYSYYDVKKSRYVTLETPPLTLSVARGKETDGGGVIVSGTSRKDVKTLGDDIRYINTKNPALVSKGDFFVGSGLFLTLLSVLMLSAVAAWFMFRQYAARRADVVRTKSRKATKMALKRLKLANSFLGQNLYTAFYEELHKALLGFISDKLNIPAAELSKERISESLNEGGVDDSLVAGFIGILDDCEFARYAPDAGHEAMAAHYESAVDVISSIDSNMKSKMKSGKGAVLTLVMLMALPFAASAQEINADSLWNAANAAYSEGRWLDAAEGYEKISEMGLESAPLYCNMGNAYFKDMDEARAILCYERALKLDPSYSDARYNLELVNANIQDRIDPVPDFVLKAWMRDICYMTDSDAWAVSFLVLLGLTLAMVLLFLLAPSVTGRRAGFYTGIITLLLAVFSLIFSIWQKNDYESADEAIVMRPVTSVKSSPSSETAKDLFVLHEGTKVTILEEVGSWKNIELADGRQGWLPSDDLEII